MKISLFILIFTRNSIKVDNKLSISCIYQSGSAIDIAIFASSAMGSMK